MAEYDSLPYPVRGHLFLVERNPNLCVTFIINYFAQAVSHFLTKIQLGFLFEIQRLLTITALFIPYFQMRDGKNNNALQMVGLYESLKKRINTERSRNRNEDMHK